MAAYPNIGGVMRTTMAANPIGDTTSTDNQFIEEQFAEAVATVMGRAIQDRMKGSWNDAVMKHFSTLYKSVPEERIGEIMSVLSLMLHGYSQLHRDGIEEFVDSFYRDPTTILKNVRKQVLERLLSDDTDDENVEDEEDDESGEQDDDDEQDDDEQDDDGQDDDEQDDEDTDEERPMDIFDN